MPETSLSLKEQVQKDKERQWNAIMRSKQLKRTTYDVDWGETVVDQGLSDDPPPINSGRFKPVKRWLVFYRAPESGVDGTKNLTVTDMRTSISGSGATTIQQFIVHEYNIWLAPLAVSTHFTGVLYTQDDQANGILGGQYSDIAPYGEFVKFRVRFKGEGQVVDQTTSGTQVLVGVGGSSTWHANIYALVSMYD